MTELLEAPAADVITYIPADPGRLLERGHHPAERLARGLGGRWGLEVAALLAPRAAVRPRQAELDRADRVRNARDAYLASTRPPATVLLVDDVYTTGATVSAGAWALRKGGATRVDVVTFARTIRL